MDSLSIWNFLFVFLKKYGEFFFKFSKKTLYRSCIGFFFLVFSWWNFTNIFFLSLYLLFFQLLIFPIIIDSSSTLIVCWLWVILGWTTIYLLIVLLPKDFPYPFSARWVVSCYPSGASSIYSSGMPNRVVPSTWCSTPSPPPCIVGWAISSSSFSFLSYGATIAPFSITF
jgi:hypothetical protein